MITAPFVTAEAVSEADHILVIVRRDREITITQIASKTAFQRYDERDN
jgi:hypothetical protein